MFLFLIFLSAYSAVCKKLSIPFVLPARWQSTVTVFDNSLFFRRVVPRLALSLYLCTWFMPVEAQTNWELKKNEDGIRVYSASVPNSHINAVKVECTINCTMPKLIALLTDAKAHEQWVFHTKTSYIVKKISDTEQYYYSEIAMPWPLKNRDNVVHLKLSQHTANTTWYVNAESVKGYVNPYSDKVRIYTSTVSWKITPVNDHQLKIEYVGQADPGGAIPAWVSNMFCTKGPFETFKKLAEIAASL